MHAIAELSTKKLQIFSSIDPCDCDHERSQNKTETTQQSRVNKRIRNIHIMLLLCLCVCELRASRANVESKNGRWNVAYTNFNKSDWFYAITAYSFNLLSLLGGFMEERKIFITHFLCFCLFSHILHSSHTAKELRKRIGDLCERKNFTLPEDVFSSFSFRCEKKGKKKETKNCQVIMETNKSCCRECEWERRWIFRDKNSSWFYFLTKKNFLQHFHALNA